MKCSKCGADITSEDNFCPFCGAKQASTVNKTYQEETATKKLSVSRIPRPEKSDRTIFDFIPQKRIQRNNQPYASQAENTTGGQQYVPHSLQKGPRGDVDLTEFLGSYVAAGGTQLKIWLNDIMVNAAFCGGRSVQINPNEWGIKGAVLTLIDGKNQVTFTIQENGSLIAFTDSFVIPECSNSLYRRV